MRSTSTPRSRDSRRSSGPRSRCAISPASTTRRSPPCSGSRPAPCGPASPAGGPLGRPPREPGAVRRPSKPSNTMTDSPDPLAPDVVDELLSAELDGEFDAAAADHDLDPAAARARLEATPGIDERRTALAAARAALAVTPVADDVRRAHARNRGGDGRADRRAGVRAASDAGVRPGWWSGSARPRPPCSLVVGLVATVSNNADDDSSVTADAGAGEALTEEQEACAWHRTRRSRRRCGRRRFRRSRAAACGDGGGRGHPVRGDPRPRVAPEPGGRRAGLHRVLASTADLRRGHRAPTSNSPSRRPTSASPNSRPTSASSPSPCCGAWGSSKRPRSTCWSTRPIADYMVLVVGADVCRVGFVLPSARSPDRSPCTLPRQGARPTRPV